MAMQIITSASPSINSFVLLMNRTGRFRTAEIQNVGCSTMCGDWKYTVRRNNCVKFLKPDIRWMQYACSQFMEAKVWNSEPYMFPCLERVTFHPRDKDRFVITPMVSWRKTLGNYTQMKRSVYSSSQYPEHVTSYVSPVQLDTADEGAIHPNSFPSSHLPLFRVRK